MAKSYRKFIAGAATAAVVGSAFAGVAGAAGFKDVDSSTTHQEGILALVEAGIIKGYDDGTFRPYAQITRGEAAILTARALGILDGKNIPANPFKDVSENQAAYEAIVKLADKGIVSGFTNDTFKPYETVTRAQVAKYVALAYGYEPADGITKFPDVNENSALAPFVDVLADAGIIEGKSNGNFGYNDALRRADFSGIVYRAEQAKKKPDDKPIVKSAVTITADDDKGNSVTNGDQKKYKIKVTNPVAPDKPVAGVKVNITFKENLNTNSKPQNNIYVSNGYDENGNHRNNLVPYQSNDSNQQVVTVTTDYKGEAELIITGANGSVTPIAFLDGTNQEWDTKGGIEFGNQDGRFDAKYEWYAQADKVTFSAEKYTITVTGKRDKFAAIKDDTNNDGWISGDEFNGRKYEILVKDKDGNPYNGIVNVGVEELVDTDGTNDYTDARILVGGVEYIKTTVRTDVNGKADFTLVSPTENDIATPVVWIDHNYSNNPQFPFENILDENDSRSGKGKVEYTNFQAPYVDDDAEGAELRTIDTLFADNEGVGFNLVLLNQSGKPYSPNAVDGLKARVTFTIKNDGPNPIYVDTNDGFWGDVEATAGRDYRPYTLLPGTFIVESHGQITISGDITNDTWFWWFINNNDDYLVNVYTNDGDAKVTVNASAVISDDTNPRSQSVSVEAGPVTKTVTSTGRFGGTTATSAVGDDSNDVGTRRDQIRVTFEEDVRPNGTNSFDPGDFRLLTASGHVTPSSVAYAKDPNNTQKSDENVLVLQFTDEAVESAIASNGTLQLEYNGEYGNSSVYLIDEHGSKLRNFGIRVQ